MADDLRRRYLAQQAELGGDEVILPTFTMIATINAVTYTGATPVLIDSEPCTWTMDVEQLAGNITSKTKAIIPVHTYGHPVDMDPLMDLAVKHGIFVMEDAAEAHGAEYKGRRAGGLGQPGARIQGWRTAQFRLKGGYSSVRSM